MSDANTHPTPESDPVGDTAARWLWRIDRGLTPEEQDALFRWLAADPENADRLARCRRQWHRLDRLGEWRPEHSLKPNPDLLAPTARHRVRRWIVPVLLAAACLALTPIAWQFLRVATDPAEIADAPRPEDRRILPDGSVLKLNADTAFTLAYTGNERRIRLEHGEAFFIVRRDPSRPFVVEAGGVTVRAIGTAFNIRLVNGGLDVLVAEGRVAVVQASAAPSPESAAPPAPETAVLEANQRVSLALVAPTEPQIATLTRREIQQTLAWQHGLMTLTDKPLAEIAAELNRLNTTQLRLLDERTSQLLFSGTIRSDNLEGFARLLENAFGVEVGRSPNGDLLLRLKTE
jgi:transmembrane sensor